MNTHLHYKMHQSCVNAINGNALVNWKCWTVAVYRTNTYDMRCYFNVYSKDDKSQLNLRDIFHQTIRRAKVRQNEKKRQNQWKSNKTQQCYNNFVWCRPNIDLSACLCVQLSMFLNMFCAIFWCQDTSDPRHFGTGAEVSVRHFGTSAEVSGHFGIGAEMSVRHFSTEVSLV